MIDKTKENQAFLTNAILSVSVHASGRDFR